MPVFFFFFNDTATTEIYTLSLHDALPICGHVVRLVLVAGDALGRLVGELDVPAHRADAHVDAAERRGARSEEHTSELQSRQYLVCRLLLEKKKKLNK